MLHTNWYLIQNLKVMLVLSYRFIFIVIYVHLSVYLQNGKQGTYSLISDVGHKIHRIMYCRTQFILLFIHCIYRRETHISLRTNANKSHK